FEDNQVLSVITNSTHLHKDLLIQDGTVRMLFLRFRYASQLSCSFGSSFASYPTQFGDFSVELSLTSTTNELRINNDGQYDVLTILEPNIWYNCWLLIDNLDNTTQVWLHSRPGEDANSFDQLEVEGEFDFGFRNGTTIDLKTFFVKTGGGSGVAGPLYLDDIHLETTDALNLTNPSPATPAAVTTSTVPAVLHLAPCRPSPFNSGTKINFSLLKPAHTSIAIFDTRGRMVIELMSEDLNAGNYQRIWSGRDRGGRRVENGVYYIRMEAGSTITTERAIFLR
ncbi:MAG: T9SS type A sorting domain-containing protein, partial [Candidatus Eisenbacteria bacterium]|nr:T9SS type A sorting domain-containing protein [Candidatus Eisenbacteria bacterium]